MPVHVTALSSMISNFESSKSKSASKAGQDCSLDKGSVMMMVLVEVVKMVMIIIVIMILMMMRMRMIMMMNQTGEQGCPDSLEK